MTSTDRHHCFSELRSLEDEKNAIVIADEEKIAEYYDLRQTLDSLHKDLRDVLNHPTYALPFLQPGRLIRVKHENLDFGWGVVVNYQKRLGPKASQLGAIPPITAYSDNCLLDFRANLSRLKSLLSPTTSWMSFFTLLPARHQRHRKAGLQPAPLESGHAYQTRKGNLPWSQSSCQR